MNLIIWTTCDHFRLFLISFPLKLERGFIHMELQYDKMKLANNPDCRMMKIPIDKLISMIIYVIYESLLILNMYRTGVYGEGRGIVRMHAQKKNRVRDIFFAGL